MSAVQEQPEAEQPAESGRPAVSRRRIIARAATVAAGGVGLTAVAATPAAADDLGQGTVGYTSTNQYRTLIASNTGDGSGIHGEANTGLAGVYGSSLGGGAGVYGWSSTTYGLVGRGGIAPLRLYPREEAGPPTSGLHLQGAVAVDCYGRMFMCVRTGEPGVWVRPGFNAINPWRVCDTRHGTGTDYSTGIRLGAGKTLTISFSYEGSPVPYHSHAVALNVTVTNASAASFLSVYPADTGRPIASSINFTAGQTLANGVTAKLPEQNSDLRIYNHAGAVHVIVDVAGFYF